jgi:predicted lipoprotein with Yx(FWY)xxD motif
MLAAGLLLLGSVLVAPRATQAATTAAVQTAAAQILVNQQGMTLYVYAPDKKNVSACTGPCAQAWPPLTVPSGMKPPASMPGIAGQFSEAPRADGTQQLTYDGAPLYTWVKDKKPGDITGQGIGNAWWAVVAPTSPISGTTATTAPQSGSSTASAALVKTAPARILVDQHGMTLYVYTADKKNQSTCTDACATAWPPLELAAGSPPQAASAGITGTFGEAARADGSHQLSFDGAPLYTWFKDKSPGDMTGQGVGGVWWAAVAPAAAGGAPALVKAAAGQILVDQQGMTLYVYAADKKGQSACTGQCAQAWPPLLAPAGTTVPAVMAGIAGTFGETTRADGSHQITFDGAPLYTWFKDKKPGDMSGQGIGGVWWVVVAPESAA